MATFFFGCKNLILYVLLPTKHGVGNVHLPRKRNYFSRTCGRSIYFSQNEMAF